MSEPFSDKEKFNMDTALQSSRSAMPFIEDDEDLSTNIKSEVKNEANGHQSPLFEPHVSVKRAAEDDMSTMDSKKPKIFTESGPRAYGGGPVRQYVLGMQYRYSKHEAVPQLEVHSKHHQDAVEHFLFSLREVALPALSPYRDEDKSVNDTVEWLEKNANIPAIPPTLFALTGNSGSGKTTTLNNVLGMSGLANADASMESVTQNPQIFNHGTQDAMFLVEVLFINRRAIENLIKKCVKDLVDYVKSISGDEADEENDYIRDSAEASKQVFDDLFSHQDGLKSLDDVEDFLEARDLLPHGDEEITDEAVDSLHKQIRDRASLEGIDLDQRRLIFTAGNIGELHAKTARFSERGAFAPLVSSIRTKTYSHLLAMGIEFADLPGYTDTNIHLRKTSMAYLVNCPKVIFVADLSRCLTTPELEKSLRETIKLKGAENVCLVLRGKENVDKSRSKWSKAESAHLETLEKSMKAAQLQLEIADADDESITLQAKANVQAIQRQILEYRIAVRDRIVTDHFSRKKYQNKHDAGKIRVITVANKCHEHYMNGSNKAVLSFDQTGIRELRAYMCETPSRDRVRAFARHSANCITKMRRLAIWADGPKMPPRDAAMALFEQHTHWRIEGYRVSLIKASAQYKKLLNTRFTSTWADAAQKTMDSWAAKYAARTQGVFIRQGGRHNPKIKGSKSKKPELVSWIEDLLVVVEDDVPSLLKSTWDAINEAEGNICENISGVIDKIRHGLEMLDTIGGANLDGVFELFEEEGKSCTRDIKEGIVELKTNLRSTALRSVTDEPCDDESPVFVREMFKIFKTTFTKFPPGTKNVTKERMKYIVEQVLSGKGPYHMLNNEVSSQLGPVIDTWAGKATARIEKMHADLRDVLFKSFEGKKMSDARREEIAPAIKAAMEKARAVLQADLDGYAADVL
ncbi:hypothetical protein KCU73_g3918, partial [Aureobasidium melanogenum]